MKSSKKIAKKLRKELSKQLGHDYRIVKDVYKAAKHAIARGEQTL